MVYPEFDYYLFDTKEHDYENQTYMLYEVRTQLFSVSEETPEDCFEWFNNKTKFTNYTTTPLKEFKETYKLICAFNKKDLDYEIFKENFPEVLL